MPPALPARGPDGLCIAVARGEAGEAIGKIAGGAARFEGYTDAAATEKKDPARCVQARRRLAAQRRPDAPGCGRASSISWTGSATPSAGRARMSPPPKSQPRPLRRPASKRPTSMAWPCRAQSGKCGMAALEVEAGFDPTAFRTHMRAAPARLCPAGVPAHRGIAQPHRDLQAEKTRTGAGRLRSLPAITDPLYADCGTGYVPLDAALYARINSGLIRL